MTRPSAAYSADLQEEGPGVTGRQRFCRLPAIDSITETEFHFDTVFVLIYFRGSENMSGMTSNVMDLHSLVKVTMETDRQTCKINRRFHYEAR